MRFLVKGSFILQDAYTKSAKISLPITGLEFLVRLTKEHFAANKAALTTLRRIYTKDPGQIWIGFCFKPRHAVTVCRGTGGDKARAFYLQWHLSPLSPHVVTP